MADYNWFDRERFPISTTCLCYGCNFYKCLGVLLEVVSFSRDTKVSLNQVEVSYLDLKSVNTIADFTSQHI
jgi:hypothetical protein